MSSQFTTNAILKAFFQLGGSAVSAQVENDAANDGLFNSHDPSPSPTASVAQTGNNERQHGGSITLDGTYTYQHTVLQLTFW
jgi:hypothetical protein